MAFADTQKLIVELDLKGNLTRGLNDAARAVKGFDKATSNTQRSLSKFGGNIAKTAAIGAAAFAATGVAVVNAARDYESAFAGVRKTVSATDEQLDKLSDQFRSLAKTIPISAANLASLGEIGGALGVPIENMEEFVRVTALLGVTTDLTAEDAANSLGILGNVLHLTGEDYDNFASSLVALGNAGASTESQIIAIAERAGAAADLIGVSADQVLGFSSAIASLGIEPEAGGTALQKFFIDTAGFIAEGGDELETFAKISGTSAKQIKKNFEKDAGGALKRFLANLGKLSQGDQIRALRDLGFNDARITRTLLGLANNTELVTEQTELASDAYRKNTALTKEAEQRFKTFDSQLQITKNVLTDIGITIGSKLLPKLTPLLKRLNDFINSHQGDIEKFGDDLATSFDKFATAIGKVDWQPFIDGLQLSAQLAKGAFDVFNAIPDDLKALILAAVGINKFTGGLPVSIGKDIAGAIGGQFFARGSSPANPLWVQSVGGPLGGVGATGGGGGLLGKLGSAAVKVTIVGMAAEVANLIEPTTTGAGIALHDALGLGVPKIKPEDISWPFGPKNTPTILPEIFGGNGLLGGNAGQPEKVRVPESPRLVAKMGEVASRQNITNERLEAIKAAQAKIDLVRGEVRNASAQDRAIAAANQQAAFAIRDKVQSTGINTAAHLAALKDKEAQTAAAAREAGRQSAAAIRDKDLSVAVDVHTSTNVSVQTFNKTFNTYKSIYKVAS